MSHPFDPPPELLKWLKDEPVRQVRLWDDRLAWVITRYNDVRDVLRNEACVSVDPKRPGFPPKSAAYSAVLGLDRTVRTVDNPEHGIQKRMLMRDFTLSRKLIRSVDVRAQKIEVTNQRNETVAAAEHILKWVRRGPPM